MPIEIWSNISAKPFQCNGREIIKILEAKIMRKVTAWLLVFVTYLSFIAPAGVNAQVLGKTMDQKLKDLPDGL